MDPPPGKEVLRREKYSSPFVAMAGFAAFLVAGVGFLGAPAWAWGLVIPMGCLWLAWRGRGQVSRLVVSESAVLAEALGRAEVMPTAEIKELRYECWSDRTNFMSFHLAGGRQVDVYETVHLEEEYVLVRRFLGLPASEVPKGLASLGQSRPAEEKLPERSWRGEDEHERFRREAWRTLFWPTAGCCGVALATLFRAGNVGATLAMSLPVGLVLIVLAGSHFRNQPDYLVVTNHRIRWRIRGKTKEVFVEHLVSGTLEQRNGRWVVILFTVQAEQVFLGLIDVKEEYELISTLVC